MLNTSKSAVSFFISVPPGSFFFILQNHKRNVKSRGVFSEPKREPLQEAERLTAKSLFNHQNHGAGMLVDGVSAVIVVVAVVQLTFGKGSPHFPRAADSRNSICSSKTSCVIGFLF
jgi:hypothetical protein